jgi:hypothetical protein
MTYCSNASINYVSGYSPSKKFDGSSNASVTYSTPQFYASKMPKVNYDFFKTNIAYAASSSAPKIFTL